jgi:hypothetical protein
LSLIREAAEIRQLAVKAEQFGPAVSAVREKAQISGLRIDRNLVRAQHEIKVEEIGDFELFEAQVRSLKSMCESFGLDPETCSVSEFIDRMMDAEEASQEKQPARYRHMPRLPNSARGNRASDFRKLPKPEKPLTQGEADRLRRAPGTNGTGTNGTGRR